MFFLLVKFQQFEHRPVFSENLAILELQLAYESVERPEIPNTQREIRRQYAKVEGRTVPSYVPLILLLA